MPTPTYTPLATVTLGSSASSVTFSSIPATYRDLVLVFVGLSTSSSSADIVIQVNGDGGNNYSRVQTNNAGSGLNASLPGFYPLFFRNSQAMFTINFMDYSATDKHKTALSRGNNNDLNFVTMMASRWANTAAISSMVLTIDNASSFATGSTFNLYGIEA
jgi:hypothetical protein